MNTQPGMTAMPGLTTDPVNGSIVGATWARPGPAEGGGAHEQDQQHAGGGDRAADGHDREGGAAPPNVTPRLVLRLSPKLLSVRTGLPLMKAMRSTPRCGAGRLRCPGALAPGAIQDMTIASPGRGSSPDPGDGCHRMSPATGASMNASMAPPTSRTDRRRCRSLGRGDRCTLSFVPRPTTSKRQKCAVQTISSPSTTPSASRWDHWCGQRASMTTGRPSRSRHTTRSRSPTSTDTISLGAILSAGTSATQAIGRS